MIPTATWNVVIPSFSGHLSELTRFFKSLDQFLLDKDLIEFHVTVSARELDEFRERCVSRFPSLRISIHSLAEVLRSVEDIEIDEDILLDQVGKFNFQAIKKLWTVKYVDAETVLVMDSEAVAIRPFKFSEVFLGWCDQPRYFYSSHHEDSFKTEVTENCLKILRRPWLDVWAFDYQYWFFERRYVDELFKVGKASDSSSLYGEFLQRVPIFELQLYLLLVHEKQPDIFLDSLGILEQYFAPNDFTRLLATMKKRGSVGLEYLSWAIRGSDWRPVSRFFDEYGLRFFKYDDRFGDQSNIAAQRNLVFANDSISVLPCLVNPVDFSRGEVLIRSNTSGGTGFTRVVSAVRTIIWSALLNPISLVSNLRDEGLATLKLHWRVLLGRLARARRSGFRRFREFSLPAVSLVGAVLPHAGIHGKRLKAPSLLGQSDLIFDTQSLAIHSKLAIDIGAFDGNSLPRLVSMGFSRVVCVEPNPSSFRKLIQVKSSADLTFVRRAVSQESGRIRKLLIDLDHPFLSSLEKDWVPLHQQFGLYRHASSCFVRTVTLDSLILAIGELPSYVKIDAEGHELEVLKSLSPELAPPLISAEWVEETPAQTVAILDRLSELGFEGFVFLEEESLPSPDTVFRSRLDVIVPSVDNPSHHSVHKSRWGNLWAIKARG